MSLLIYKYLHLLGVILFLGNIIVTAYWKFAADRTRDAKVIAFAQRQVTLTDYFFTVPGVLLIIVAGDVMAFIMFEKTWEVTWVSSGRLIFGITGLIWLTVLIPTQIKQARIAREFDISGTIPQGYWKLSRRWNIFGAMAIIFPLVVLAIMIGRPV